MQGNEFVANVEESMLRGKRDHNLDSVSTMSDKQNLHEYLERKAESAVRGEIAAHKRLCEAEAGMEMRRWEQKNSEVALYESHRELESQRLQLHQAHQWADQAQREKINLCGELELKNRIGQESHTRASQEIEELRRICCEETNRVRHLRIKEWSMQQERDPNIVSQPLTQIWDLQDKASFLSDEREFHDPSSRIRRI